MNPWDPHPEYQLDVSNLSIKHPCDHWPTLVQTHPQKAHIYWPCMQGETTKQTHDTSAEFPGGSYTIVPFQLAGFDHARTPNPLPSASQWNQVEHPPIFLPAFRRTTPGSNAPPAFWSSFSNPSRLHHPNSPLLTLPTPGSPGRGSGRARARHGGLEQNTSSARCSGHGDVFGTFTPTTESSKRPVFSEVTG